MGFLRELKFEKQDMIHKGDTKGKSTRNLYRNTLSLLIFHETFLRTTTERLYPEWEFWRFQTSGVYPATMEIIH